MPAVFAIAAVFTMPNRGARAGSSCELVYLDVGSNIGDSLHAFAFRRPEARLREALKAAGAASYQTATTCAFGFEPNPQHTARLQATQARLGPKFANLTVYTETAVGGPEQVAAPMWLVLAGGSKGVGSHLTTTRPVVRHRASPHPCTPSSSAAGCATFSRHRSDRACLW